MCAANPYKGGFVWQQATFGMLAPFLSQVKRKGSKQIISHSRPRTSFTCSQSTRRWWLPSRVGCPQKIGPKQRLAPRATDTSSPYGARTWGNGNLSTEINFHCPCPCASGPIRSDQAYTLIAIRNARSDNPTRSLATRAGCRHTPEHHPSKVRLVTCYWEQTHPIHPIYLP
jgi:hypothetical protein